LVALIMSAVLVPGGDERGTGVGVHIALASQSGSQPAQNPTATPATPAAPGGLAPSSGNSQAPTPVSTSGAGAGPGAVGTAPAAVSTGVVGGTSQGGTSSRSSGGDFPWLIVLLVALIVLAGLGYAAMRQREPAQVAAGPEGANLRR